MHIEQLPASAQSSIEALLAAIDKALSSSPSAHLSAISDSAMENGTSSTDTLSGGQLRAPAKPPFRYDKVALGALHRAVFEASDAALYGMVVHCRRADLQSPWRCTTKLVSRDEHAFIESQRRSIDEIVHAALKAFNLRKDREWLSFGRNRPEQEPELISKSASAGLERFPPTPQLMELLRQTEQIYEKSGLRLRIAEWTLENDLVDFREYWE